MCAIESARVDPGWVRRWRLRKEQGVGRANRIRTRKARLEKYKAFDQICR